MIWTKEKIENRQAYIKKLIGTIGINDSGGEVVRLRQELDLLDALSTAESRNAEREAALLPFAAYGGMLKRQGNASDTVVSAGMWSKPRPTGIPGIELPEIIADMRYTVADFIKAHEAHTASPSAIEEEMGGTEKQL